MGDRAVIVVGGGAAGVLAAAHLLPTGAEVVLVERGGAERLARGVAYGTGDPLHRLNVPAARMSALPDAPDDFARWWARTDGGAADGFAPRARYGAYLAEVLADAARRGPGRLRVVSGEAIAAAVDGAGAVRVALDDGRRLDGRALILALGAFAPRRCGRRGAPPSASRASSPIPGRRARRSTTSAPTRRCSSSAAA